MLWRPGRTAFGSVRTLRGCPDFLVSLKCCEAEHGIFHGIDQKVYRNMLIFNEINSLVNATNTRELLQNGLSRMLDKRF